MTEGEFQIKATLKMLNTSYFAKKLIEISSVRQSTSSNNSLIPGLAESHQETPTFSSLFG
jgi:hypothetical protein